MSEALLVAGLAGAAMSGLSPGFELREYQRQGLGDIHEAFHSKRWVLYCLPTGAGKTILFSHIAAATAVKGFCAVVIVHRVEMLRQVAETLSQCGVPCGMIAAGEPENIMERIQVATIASLYRRVKKGRYHQSFRLVVLDEAHHSVATMWRETVPLILAERGRVLGVTATPQRTDGKGLDVFPDGAQAFERLVCGPDIAELVRQGYLCPAQTYVPAHVLDVSSIRVRRGDYDQTELARAFLQQPEITGDCVAHYKRLANNRPMLCFCASIEHSRLVAETFIAEGIPARHVDCETPADERKAAIKGIADGSLKIVTNFALFTEGLDCPGIAGVIHHRPTKSFGLYQQINGRGLRIFPGKSKALILDHVGNSHEHGLYDDPVQWKLSGREPKEKDEALAPLRRCPECGLVNPVSAAECGNCDFEFETVRRDRLPLTADGELKLVTDELQFRLRRMTYEQLLQWAGGSRERLIVVAKTMNYRPAWVDHRQREFAAVRRGD
jgi:DNA repair protein RadD